MQAVSVFYFPLLAWYLPHFYVWQFAMGWMILGSTTQVRRFGTMAVLIACLSLLALIRGKTGDITLIQNSVYWLLGGTTALLWMRPIKLPTPLGNGISIVARSVLVIYLFHMLFRHVAVERLGIDNGFVSFLLGLVGSISIWVALEAIGSALTARSASRQLELESEEMSSVRVR